MTNFAILNFKSACIKFPRPCRLDFEKVITAETISEIPSAFEQLESLLDEGYHACIYICKCGEDPPVSVARGRL